MSFEDHLFHGVLVRLIGALIHQIQTEVPLELIRVESYYLKCKMVKSTTDIGNGGNCAMEQRFENEVWQCDEVFPLSDCDNNDFCFNSKFSLSLFQTILQSRERESYIKT